jgi:transcription-repair coupling factor (superfamily II helicase)
MTATPIPRTLQMACLGVKDLSLITTPPAERQSIETKILKFDKKIIRRGILKELERGGQVYFVHNRVSTIYQIAEQLKELVPEAKIAVAYGQMDKNDLEVIYKDFIEKKYQILVCTTIIESGLDNPNVNTIFINRADKFGISQLYQLRGRVGRSNVKAYAYFIIIRVLNTPFYKQIQASKFFYF